MIRFDILTIFPCMFESIMNESIIGRAQKNNLIKINPINIRDFSDNKHLKTDDYPYGGGSGMVMTPGPIYNAYRHITNALNYKPKVIYLSPQGKVLTQELVKSYSAENHMILLCGHYEGVDERIIEEIVDEEISIGDYVLTGGELAAMVFIDAVSRLIPGVLHNKESANDESHSNFLLEYPQYTRPYEFLGKTVPEVLVSGHHANIEKWRLEQSIERTKKKRPDLYAKYIESKMEIE